MAWAAYLRDSGFSQDEEMCIKVNETAIPFHVGGRAANRLQAPTKQARNCMAEKVSLQQKRASCTFVAAVANEPRVQKGLPQELLPNTKGRGKSARTRPLCWPSHKAQVMENTSGWSTMDSMIEYFTALKKNSTSWARRQSFGLWTAARLASLITPCSG